MAENDICVGFIGGGNMSSAIVRGILKNGAYEPSKIWVAGPNIQNLKHFLDMGTNVTVNNSEVFSKCDIVILGVKQGKLNDVATQCASGLEQLLEFNKERKVLIVSMLAGVTLFKLQQELRCLKCYGNINVVRIMPNTPITVGQGICLYTAVQNSHTHLMSLLLKLLKTSSVCQEVPEEMMCTLGSLTACGPAFMYMVIEALADGAVKQGVPRNLALQFAAHMVVGSGHMVLETGKHPGLLKDEVCSPGGSTISGVSALENGNLRATIINALEAAILKYK